MFSVILYMLRQTVGHRAPPCSFHLFPLLLWRLPSSQLFCVHYIGYSQTASGGLVVSVEEVPGSIPGHSLGFFWGSWVCNGVHSASWSDKLNSYLNKEVTVRFGKLKMQLRDSMCWSHVNPVPSGAVGKDCQRRLLSRPKVRQSL
jgi:hypothetical protein